MSTEVAIPNTQEIEEKAVNFSERAESIKVVDADSRSVAGEIWKLGDAMKKEIMAFFKPHKDAANKLHKNLCASEKEQLAKVHPGLQHLDNEMKTWDAEQKRKRLEEERRLTEEARKRAEEEQLQAAIEAEKDGHEEEAEAILNEKPVVAPVIIKETKSEGPSYRDNWKFRITNERAVPREFLMPDETKIGKHVRAHKGATSIPGVEPYNDPVPVGR